MRISKPFSLIIIPIASIYSFGQEKHPEKELIENSGCIQNNKYSASQRLLFYPFNSAKTVLAISFDDPKVNGNATPVSNKILDKSKIKESIILNASQINKLTNLLYNYGQNPKFPKYGSEDYKCYNPRNAIIFINEKNEIIEYIEICFQCHKFKFSSEKNKGVA